MDFRCTAAERKAFIKHSGYTQKAAPLFYPHDTFTTMQSYELSLTAPLGQIDHVIIVRRN